MKALKTVDLRVGEVISLQQIKRTTGRQCHAKNREFKRGINPMIKFKRRGGFNMAFIADMVQEKKQLVEKAEAILNEAKKEGGSLTKEQEREFDRYTNKIKSKR